MRRIFKQALVAAVMVVSASSAFAWGHGGWGRGEARQPRYEQRGGYQRGWQQGYQGGYQGGYREGGYRQDDRRFEYNRYEPYRQEFRQRGWNDNGRPGADWQQRDQGPDGQWNRGMHPQPRWPQYTGNQQGDTPQPPRHQWQGQQGQSYTAPTYSNNDGGQGGSYAGSVNGQPVSYPSWRNSPYNQQNQSSQQQYSQDDGGEQ
jgi:hypothetical protein